MYEESASVCLVWVYFQCHDRHPQEKERGRSPRCTVGTEPVQVQLQHRGVSHLQPLWGQEQGDQGWHSPVYHMSHRTWPKPGLASRLGTASGITHTTLSNSLSLHLSLFTCETEPESGSGIQDCFLGPVFPACFPCRPAWYTGLQVGLLSGSKPKVGSICCGRPWLYE